MSRKNIYHSLGDSRINVWTSYRFGAKH